MYKQTWWTTAVHDEQPQCHSIHVVTQTLSWNWHLITLNVQMYKQTWWTTAIHDVQPRCQPKPVVNEALNWDWHLITLNVQIDVQINVVDSSCSR